MADLIDRQAAINVVRDVMLDFIEYEDEIEVPMADTDKQLFSIKKAISKKIKALPSAQPERKTGKWYFDKNTFLVRCSVCGVGRWKGYCPTVDEAFGWMKFCPNCGAEMMEENNG